MSATTTPVNSTSSTSPSAQRTKARTKSSSRSRKNRAGKGTHRSTRTPQQRRGPEKEYLSKCCSAIAKKPACGKKEDVRDPETGKMKEIKKGLGHWRCGQCGRKTTVTPQVRTHEVVQNATTGEVESSAPIN